MLPNMWVDAASWLNINEYLLPFQGTAVVNPDVVSCIIDVFHPKAPEWSSLCLWLPVAWFTTQPREARMAGSEAWSGWHVGIKIKWQGPCIWISFIELSSIGLWGELFMNNISKACWEWLTNLSACLHSNLPAVSVVARAIVLKHRPRHGPTSLKITSSSCDPPGGISVLSQAFSFWLFGFSSRHFSVLTIHSNRTGTAVVPPTHVLSLCASCLSSLSFWVHVPTWAEPP